MKVAIIGSNGFDDYNLLCTTLEPYKSKIHLIIFGLRLGSKYAEHKAIRCVKYVIDKDIVNQSDCVIAFWDGISKGTNNLLNLCEKYNKPYKVIYFE